MKRIAVFGAGYVGLVTGACFAELGHDVVLRDVIPDRIDALRRGEVPIYEPGLEELIARNKERLTFTLDVAEAVEGADFLYIAVGTPPTHSGDADLSAVWTVIEEIPAGTEGVVVVMKSTVPVGTGEKVRGALHARGLTRVGYVSNPEFTAEGTAVRDFMEPDRIVIGSFEDADGDAVEELHQGISGAVVRADVNSAEMVKLAANAFLSTRISFINEIANVCELVGADVVKVAEGVGLDHRLGPHFLRAGLGFGGSCLLGDETVLVRRRGRTQLLTLERLFTESAGGERVEILTWRPDGSAVEFLPIEVLTRRWYEGDIVEVRTKMGRRVRCTPDHPFVTKNGRKLAEELTAEDWLPVPQSGPVHEPPRRAKRLNVLESFEQMGIEPRQVIVRPHASELAAVGVRELQGAAAISKHRRGAVARSHDIMRAGALRLNEAVEVDVELDDAAFGTVNNGTYTPATLEADAAFWRVVGLYIAEGHCVTQARYGQRMQWCFHPRDEQELVDEVAGFWRSHGVKATVVRAPTTTIVRVSSRLLAAWWVHGLGLGTNCYEQRLPDLIWDEPEEHKRAILSGAWLGDGSWSYIRGGPSVVLEYGTVSRELADGILRLLGELGIVARLNVGRVAKSTVDTYWLVISGADQVECVLDLVQPSDHCAIRDSIARQAKRIAPTGYRRDRNTAWLRVVDTTRKPFAGFVYSLEVPPTHTLVTTSGLTVGNCFPKDISALKVLAGNSGYHFQLLSAVIEVNELQKRRVIQKLHKHLGTLRGKTVALLGLTFKPNTDDMREAPSLVLAARLLAEGAKVRGWDPVADGSELTGVEICETVRDAVRDADAAVIVTEWGELRDLARDEIRQIMRNPLIVDGRNLLDPEQVRGAGFAYDGIGRAASPFATLPETPEPQPTS